MKNAIIGFGTDTLCMSHWVYSVLLLYDYNYSPH